MWLLLYVLSCEQHLILGIDIFGRAYIYFQFQLPPKMYFWMVRACLGMNGNNPGPEWNDVRRTVTVTPLSKMEFCLKSYFDMGRHGVISALCPWLPLLCDESNPGIISVSSLSATGMFLSGDTMCYQHTSIQSHRKYQKIVETFRRVSGPNK